MADNLDVLEKRLELLEKHVFGGSNKDAMYPKCTDTLLGVQNRLAKDVIGKKKINRIFGRLQELQECLDPAKADEMTLPDAAKIELILAEEDFLVQQAARFETLQQLEDTIDSEHIKALPSLSGQLQKLSKLQITQQDEAGKLSDDVRELMATYNNIICLLSKQFVRWDETLTQLEQARLPKKLSD